MIKKSCTAGELVPIFDISISDLETTQAQNQGAARLFRNLDEESDSFYFIFKKTYLVIKKKKKGNYQTGWKNAITIIVLSPRNEGIVGN